eukprot:Hpha_TRINITY_DN16397_c1_g6::TRINITY_DN16397_c1_g6_i1::g.62510::m.62510
MAAAQTPPEKRRRSVDAGSVSSRAEFREKLLAIDSHDRRMKLAADVGRSPTGGPIIAESAAQGDAWEAVYTIVAAAAAKDGKIMEGMVRGNNSWVVRARAAQMLGKVDGPRCVDMLMDESVPLQLRKPLLKGLRDVSSPTHDAESVLSRVLSASWGGCGEALTFLQHCKPDAAHAKASETWLPRLLGLCSAMRKEQPDQAKGFPDGQCVLQGFADIHRNPDVVLQMMETTWEWSDRWYKATQLLAKHRPDGTLKVLRKVKFNDKAVWLLARPLVHYRPREVLDVLVQRGKFDEAARWCIKLIVDGFQPPEGAYLHRGEILEAVGKMIAGPKENDSSSLSKLLDLLDHHRRRSCAQPLVMKIITSSVGTGSTENIHYGNKHKPTDAQLAALIGAARTRTEDTVRGVLNEISRQWLWGITPERLAQAWRASSEVPGAKTLFMMLKKDTSSAQQLFASLPKPVRREEAEALRKEEDFPDWDSSHRCHVIKHLPIAGDVFKEMRKLLNDRDANVRTAVLGSLMTCGVNSDDAGFGQALDFVVQRIENEQSEVKSPVLQKILVDTPRGRWRPENIIVLTRLLEATARWQGDSHAWGRTWQSFVHLVVAHALEGLREARPVGGELFSFTATVTQQLAAMRVASDSIASTLMGAAPELLSRSRKEDTIDPSTHPCIPFAIDFIASHGLKLKLDSLRKMDPITQAAPVASGFDWMRKKALKKKSKDGKKEITYWPEEERPLLLFNEVLSFVRLIGPVPFLRSPAALELVGAVLLEVRQLLLGKSGQFELLVAATVLEKYPDFYTGRRGGSDILNWPPLRDLATAAIRVLAGAAGTGELARVGGAAESWSDFALDTLWPFGKNKRWVGTVVIEIVSNAQSTFDGCPHNSVPLARALHRKDFHKDLAQLVSSWIPPVHSWAYDACGAALSGLRRPPSAHEAEAWGYIQGLVQKMGRYNIRRFTGLFSGTVKAAGTVGDAYARVPRIMQRVHVWSGGPQEAVERIASVTKSRLKVLREMQGNERLVEPLCKALEACLECSKDDEARMAVVKSILKSISVFTGPNQYFGKQRQVEPHHGEEEKSRGGTMYVDMAGIDSKGDSMDHTKKPRFRFQRDGAATRRKRAARRLRAENQRDRAQVDPAKHQVARELCLKAVETAATLVKTPHTSGEKDRLQDCLRFLVAALAGIVPGVKPNDLEQKLIDPIVAVIHKGIENKSTRSVATDSLYVILTSGLSVFVGERPIPARAPVRLTGRTGRVAGQAVSSKGAVEGLRYCLVEDPTFTELAWRAITTPHAPREITEDEKKSRHHSGSRWQQELTLQLTKEGFSTRKQLLALYLGHRGRRPGRIDQVLACEDADVLISQSKSATAYVLKERQDHAKRIFFGSDAVLSKGFWPFQGVGIYGEGFASSYARYGGQAHRTIRGLFKLPPATQRAFFDTWLKPYAFCTDPCSLTEDSALYHGELGLHRDKDDEGHELPMKIKRGAGQKESLGHDRQAAIIAIAADMASVEGCSFGPKHPFNEFLEAAAKESDERRRKDQEAKRAAKKEAKEKGAATVKARKTPEEALEAARWGTKMQLGQDIIQVMRQMDDSINAARSLSTQITTGVSTFARPGLCDALRCVSPKEAHAILDEVLLRKHQRQAGQLAAGVGARAQLCRAGIRLEIPAPLIEPLLLREYECKGIQPPKKEEDEDDDEDDGSLKDVKLNIIVSLALSSLPNDSQKLKDLLFMVRDKAVNVIGSDERAIAQELLMGLTGESSTASLNTRAWPRCAFTGLAGLCATLAQVTKLQKQALAALQRWKLSLDGDKSARVASEDAEPFMQTIGSLLADEEAVADVLKLLMTLETRGQEGSLLKTVRQIEEKAVQARRQRLGPKKEKELRQGIMKLLDLPNWQLRGSRGAVGDVSDMLLKGSFGPVGIGLRVNLLDFTAPQGAAELAAELQELVEAAERCGDWRAIGNALKEAIQGSIERQSATRNDGSVDRAVNECAETLIQSKSPAVRFLVTVLLGAIVDGVNTRVEKAQRKGAKDPLATKWVDMVYNLRDDNDVFIAVAADAVFNKFVVPDDDDDDDKKGGGAAEHSEDDASDMDSD